MAHARLGGSERQMRGHAWQRLRLSGPPSFWRRTSAACIEALCRAPGACTSAIQPAADGAGPTHKNGLEEHIMTALRLLASVVRDWPLADAVAHVPLTELLAEA